MADVSFAEATMRRLRDLERQVKELQQQNTKLANENISLKRQQDKVSEVSPWYRDPQHGQRRNYF